MFFGKQGYDILTNKIAPTKVGATLLYLERVPSKLVFSSAMTILTKELSQSCWIRLERELGDGGVALGALPVTLIPCLRTLSLSVVIIHFGVGFA